MKGKFKGKVFVTSAAATVIGLLGGSTFGAIKYAPVVEFIGDGNTPTAGGIAKPTEIRVYLPTTASQAAPQGSLAFDSTGGGTKLTTSASATSEGMLSNNPQVTNEAAVGLAYTGTAAYTFNAGYNSVTGTNGVNSAGGDRVVGRMTVTSNSVAAKTYVQTQTNAVAYDSNNIRSATGADNGTDVWTGGTGTAATTAGWRYFNTNTRLDTTSTLTNVRSVEISGTQLFGSSGSGTAGIYKIGTGTPTTGAPGSYSLYITSAGASPSPYEFALFDDPNNAATLNSGFDTAYITDDRSVANGGGIQKWTWNGSAWSLAYTMVGGSANITGIRGLAGQLDTATNNFVLYASNGTNLYQVTDTGVSSAFTSLASAGTNNVFRGVALAPIPEPGTISMLGLAAVGLLGGRRRRKA